MIQKEEMKGAGGSRSRMVMEWTRRAEGAEAGEGGGGQKGRMGRWPARTSGMRVRNTPGAPLSFRPRLRCPLRVGPVCPRGLRDKLPTRTLSLSLSSPAARLARDPRVSRRIDAPAGTRRHHANLQVERKRGTTGPLRAYFYVSGITGNLVPRRGLL